MASLAEPSSRALSPDRILFDPLSYVNAQRLRLPPSLDMPRQRAVINRMLLGDLPDERQARTLRGHPLLRHWTRLPYVCALVGAQRLKPQLAWGGRLLRLPAPVRRFMELPLPHADAPQREAAVVQLAAAQLLLVAQREGLSRLLDWQRQAPPALLGRLRLMFPPQLDACFANRREPLSTADLFLISQAILYAKNHPYHV